MTGTPFVLRHYHKWGGMGGWFAIVERSTNHVVEWYEYPTGSGGGPASTRQRAERRLADLNGDTPLRA